MGYLEVTRLHEALWIHWYGIDDMYAWQQMNGLPRDKVMICSGSVTVELIGGEMMLYCEVVPLREDGKPYFEPNGKDVMRRTISVPYVEPVPEGIGKLVDWELTLPKKRNVAEDDAA